MLVDFECPYCHTVHERIVKNRDAKVACPGCGNFNQKPLVTGTASFRLIGAGFYKRSHKDTGDWA